MEMNTEQPSDFWTGIQDIKILICVHTPNEAMKDLVLTNKEIAEICSSEIFYRLRIIKDFNADLIGYAEDPPNVDEFSAKSIKYQIAYKHLSFPHSFKPENVWYHKKMIEIGNGKTITWSTFEYACKKGYLPIIKQASRKQLLRATFVTNETATEEDYEKDYIDSMNTVGEVVSSAERWDILEVLIKEYGLPLDDISWNIMYDLSKKGDIEGYKRMVKNGLDLQGDHSATAFGIAVKHGHSDLAIFLIENQAPIAPAVYVQDWIPLFYAVKYCSVKVVKMMMDRGQNIHWNEDFVFKKDIWEGRDDIIKSKPSSEMLEYLSSIQELTWLEKENVSG